MRIVAPRRLLVRRLRGVDLLVADTLLAALVSVLSVYAATERPHAPLWLGVLIGVLVGGPLAARRTWPVPAAVAVLAASVGALLSGTIPGYAAAAPAMAIGCALYLVGLAVPGRLSVVTLAACLGGLTAALLVASTDVTGAVSGLGFAGLVVGGSWLLGWAMRERRAALAWAAEQFASQAVSEERLRIARELHDIVAHSMSLIAVKAAVANHVAQARPQEARDALRIIEATSRGALQQMRGTLGMLREGGSYTPSPGLGELAGLVEHAATGGVEVALDVRGNAELPEAVGLSVYRIVQESLTNVVKHAAPARCRVTVAIDRDEVCVDVTDDGRTAVRTGNGGHGLIGIRERVAAYGGDFTAGPRAGGGFAVGVRLPYGTGT